jgi:SAM-dependent methyltransferase
MRHREQAIQSALMLPGSRTLAVDLSRDSLAYAVRKTRELGPAERITYGQADLMALDDGRRFDIVQSAGVLHHMADPFEGARPGLRRCEAGRLHALGLYSARPADHLKPAKALGQDLQPETVRAFRQAIINAPGRRSRCAAAVASRDFYATSGCRDLLMHVQEHELDIAGPAPDPGRERPDVPGLPPVRDSQARRGSLPGEVPARSRPGWTWTPGTPTRRNTRPRLPAHVPVLGARRRADRSAVAPRGHCC